MLASLRFPLVVLLLVLTSPEAPSSTPPTVRPVSDKAAAAHSLTSAPAALGNSSEEIAPRPTVLTRVHETRRTLAQDPPSILPLKTHRSGVQIAASGHIKFRHASNAPPHSLI